MVRPGDGQVSAGRCWRMKDRIGLPWNPAGEGDSESPSCPHQPPGAPGPPESPACLGSLCLHPTRDPASRQGLALTGVWEEGGPRTQPASRSAGTAESETPVRSLGGLGKHACVSLTETDVSYLPWRDEALVLARPLPAPAGGIHFLRFPWNDTERRPQRTRAGSVWAAGVETPCDEHETQGEQDHGPRGRRPHVCPCSGTSGTLAVRPRRGRRLPEWGPRLWGSWGPRFTEEAVLAFPERWQQPPIVGLRAAPP